MFCLLAFILELVAIPFVANFQHLLFTGTATDELHAAAPDATNANANALYVPTERIPAADATDARSQLFRTDETTISTAISPILPRARPNANDQATISTEQPTNAEETIPTSPVNSFNCEENSLPRRKRFLKQSSKLC